MPGLSCDATGCAFVSADGTLAQQLQHLAIHAQTAHPVQQHHQGGGAPRGKVDRPVLKPLSDLEGWEFFLYEWENYKTAMGISGGTTSAHLYGCLDDDLKRDLQKSNQGVKAADMTEENMLANIKRLAVKEESKLAHRIKLGRAVQSPGVSIRTFYAQLKGLANACEYKVTHECQCHTVNTIDYADNVIQDQLVRGIADKEILADLLGDERTNRSTADIVEYIARKEQATAERTTVSGDSTAGAVTTPKRPARPCRGCDGQDHGGRAQRLSNCPARDVTCDRCAVKGHYTRKCIKCKDCQAWGHSSNKSRFCKNVEKTETAALMDNSKGFVMSQLSHISSVADINLATVGSKKGRVVPLTHHIFTDERGWIATQSAPHPTMSTITTACHEDHDCFSHPVATKDSMTSCVQPIVCDSGCQSTAIPPTAAYKVGFKRKDFFPVTSRMNGAGRSDLGVIGAVVMQFHTVTKAGQMMRTKQLCYVCTKVDKIYMSRQGLQEMGIISKNFPFPDNHSVSIIADSPQGCDCPCPPRPSTPPPRINSLPSHLTGDTQEMKNYLLQYYGATIFNICECQTLPLLPGPPLRLNVDKDAKPVACHKIQPIPLHWQEKVHRDLVRDVNLGVLEKLPTNTPTTWLSRMVLTAKSNGDPRRTVDYQPLNKHVQRQTFPMVTPFQLASRIPPGAKKTVVDNWNGFHSVPLHEDDRHYTAFLTPDGRYQYKVAAQGNNVSGDGFNERMHEIFTDFKDMVRCVDDGAMWTVGSDTTQHFLKVAEYLDICARSNIVLNPSKFQFCQDTIDFAGFQISPTCLMPSEKMLESIRKFPTPTDISGIRAYFGLINQVAYAFAMTEEMHPIRHLLSPKTHFEWTPQLERLFQQSKEVIVDKITEGVKLFDPQLPTCLATDFSGKGVGFLLLQKTCICISRLPNCCPEGWRVCLVGSRFLHDAENRYAPVEGECLAVVYGLQKCKYFLLGCTNLIVATDHKPLINILNDRSLADIDNRRLRNLKEKTLCFQFDIAHVPGRKHVGPDAASRYPVGPPVKLQLPDEHTEADFSTTEVRHCILDNLASIEPTDRDDSTLTAALECSITDLTNIHSHNCCVCTTAATSSHNVVSWQHIRMATEEDKEMQDLMKVIMSGFPDDARHLPAQIRPYAPYKLSLYIVDSVVMLGDRVVVPQALRSSILHLLHAAHQGVDRMKARSADAVYWPGIVGDIARHREACHACHRMAKSNPSLPPYDTPEPEFPFQYLAADYLHHGGKDYCVIVDRYSHWPTVFVGEQGAKGFIQNLRTLFSTFGICQELATDGASLFTGGVTQAFLKAWDVRHRLSSVANPHSNCRAELAVKQVKRIITENCGPSGSLDVDSFHRSMLSYRNTPDPYTKVSPAMAVFGRQVRDGLPVLPGHYNPHNTWRELLDHREHAMARRHIAGREQWEAHTKSLAPLITGDNVFLQNLVGNHPRRWERTGKVVECKEFDQYLVKVDGTGRSTLRNRKHLRKFQPIPKSPRMDTLPAPTHVPATPEAIQSYPSPTRNNHTDPAPMIPPPLTSHVNTLPPLAPVLSGGHTRPCDAPLPLAPHGGAHDTMEQVSLPTLPDSVPTMPGSLPTMPDTPVQSDRPRRNRVPNVRLNPEEWELGQVDTVNQFMPTMDWCLEMIKWIAKQEVDTRGGGDK